MSALRSRDYAALFANHTAMGVYGMLAGWLATAQPSLLTLCTTLPLEGRVLPVVFIHVREHLAMFAGTLFAGLAEPRCEDGLPLARAAAWRSLARPAHGELAR